MAFADSSVYKDTGNGTIIGRFDEADTGNLFEYSANDDDFDFARPYPHKVWVTTPRPGIDSGYRYATVLKTRAYVVVDEDENGPVIEKWFFKQNSHKEYV
jgi:hypothetical protein